MTNPFEFNDNTPTPPVGVPVTTQPFATKPEGKLPADVVTELMDPTYAGRAHYSDATAHKCRGPLCSRYHADKSRYARRVKSVAKAVAGTGNYLPRDGGERAEGRAEQTRIILAVLMANGRQIPFHLISACDRDGVKIPSVANLPEGERGDLITLELIQEVEARREAQLEANREEREAKAKEKAKLDLARRIENGEPLTPVQQAQLGIPLVDPTSVEKLLAFLDGESA